MKLISKLFNDHKILRYLVAGGIAAAVDLSILYFLTTILGIWYLFSAIIAFLFAFGVSFYLQKFWTFADRSVDRLSSQMIFYFIITSINLSLNTLLMFAFVDGLHWPYLFAQIIVSALIAGESFFVYQKFIFKLRV